MRQILKGAIMGFGEVAQKAHAEAFLKRKNEIKIAAVADTNRERLAEARKFFPQASLYLSSDELLKKEKNLDFVDIAAPPSFHYTLIMKALKKGINVLCEKPLVLELTHLKTIKKTAASKKLVVFTAHNWKYSPQMIKIRETLKKKTLGEIKYANFFTLRKKPSVSAAKGWRKNPKISGGGILIDHGWHIFYLLMNMAGGYPESVSAKLYIPKGKNSVDEKAECFINFGKTEALAHMSWKSPVRKNTAFIYGTKGVLEMLDDSIIIETEKGSEKTKFRKPLSKGSAHPEWMALLVNDFLKELKKPRGDNLKEAEYCLKLILGSKTSNSMNNLNCRL